MARSIINELENEKGELDNKILKLSSFIESANFSAIDVEQQILLRVQIQSMRTYSTVLLERIYCLSKSQLN